MVKFGKKITVNLGNYENVALEVSEADSFEECDVLLNEELASLKLKHNGVSPDCLFHIHGDLG